MAGLWAGCAPTPAGLVREVDDPAYQRGLQLLRENRPTEALEAFLRVTTARFDAPESHLEAGLISLQHLQDPVTATYHFRRYLALAPEGERAPQVRQLLETAAKEFARTLPGDPYASGVLGGGASANQLETLRAENERLRRELAALQARAGVPATAPAPAATPEVPVAPRPVNPPAPRIHTVAAGDNFSSLARQYGVSVEAIRRANPGVDSSRLRIGQTVVIPAGQP